MSAVERRLQIERAQTFRAMHEAGRVLVLPNAWDAASAKLYEREGFEAVGTTSAGIAAALGYPDGETMPLDDNLSVCRTIARSIGIPLSVDIEAGYAGCLAGLAETIAKVIDCGAVGVNLEDSAKAGCGGAGSGALVDIPAQCERIAAAREAAERAGVPIVINARADVYLVHGEPFASRLADAVERGNAYRRAGADCVFVPDMESLGETEIATLVQETHAPLNVIAGKKTPSVPRLQELGVARLSFGPRPMRAALYFLRNMAREWRAEGTYSALTSSAALSYDEVNEWFAGREGGAAE
ncbi:MAG: isocitrate lyase/phosphoenolpyruvate mutase family protein [Candidatus Bipolaricaulis sp.]|nr:isocitrate lyase/phosphoenolpyruvate mutase family protein [Candidatus Bipolaricaulis sp.]